MPGRYSASDLTGFLNLVLRRGQDFTKAYGISLAGIFKPFRTKPDPSGVPSYFPVFLTQVPGMPISGSYGASASGLNPFGLATQYEGVLSGTGVRGRDLNTDIQRDDVRSFGLKTPATLVGYGYDIFGFPAPNQQLAWNIYRGTSILGSGAFGDVPPSGAFKISATGWNTTGAYVPEPLWRAGPLDVRWDPYMGRWRDPRSVQAARILCAYTGGVAITGQPMVYASDVQYDVRLFDGPANQFTLSGIVHVGPKPFDDAYKVRPYASGDFCFLVHYMDGTGTAEMPRFGAWLVEMPGVTQCASGSTTGGDTGGGDDGDIGALYSGPADGPPMLWEGSLSGTGLLAGLNAYPLTFAQGGLGLSTIASGQILMGSTGNTIIKKSLVAGSGLTLDFSTSGVARLTVSTGTIFIATGTALPIANGGTGSTTRVFVSTTGNETIAGTKRYSDTVRFMMGSSGIPGIGFSSGSTALNLGLFVNSTHGLSVYNSGTIPQTWYPTGIVVGQRLVLQNTTVDNNEPVLTIFRNIPNLSVASGDLIRYKDYDGTSIGGFTPSGTSYSKSVRLHNASGYVNVTSNVASGNFECMLPTGGQLVSTAMLATGIAVGYTGDVDVGAGTLTIVGGIITGYTASP